ncbi:MAG: hypothetical protein OHK0039_26800 [Bacteroidia bacterium]
MPVSTKQRILEAAIRCFNRQGAANTRLQHIADEADGMSVGNLAYHFRNKAAIVQAIWEVLEQQQRVFMAEFRILALFEDIERQLYHSHQIQLAYPFFYLDTPDLLRTYPQIGQAYRQHMRWQQQQIEIMLTFNVSRGAFLPETLPGQHKALAYTYLTTLETWPGRRYLLGEEDRSYAAFRDTLWMLLSGCFTDLGRAEYTQLEALRQLQDSGLTGW